MQSGSEQLPSEGEEHKLVRHSWFFPLFVGCRPPPPCRTSHYPPRPIARSSDSHLSGFVWISGGSSRCSQLNEDEASLRPSLSPAQRTVFPQALRCSYERGSLCSIRPWHHEVMVHGGFHCLKVCLFVIQNIVKPLRTPRAVAQRHSPSSRGSCRVPGERWECGARGTSTLPTLHFREVPRHAYTAAPPDQATGLSPVLRDAKEADVTGKQAHINR